MHSHHPTRESRVRAGIRLVALALALTAAWPAAAEHPRRDYACFGPAPSASALTGQPSLTETAAVREEPASPDRSPRTIGLAPVESSAVVEVGVRNAFELAPAASYFLPFRASSPERGPPRVR
jgi:hypothetical protein